jgi:integrase
MSVRKLKGSWWVDFRWNYTRYRKRSPLNTRAGAQEYELVLRRQVMVQGGLEPAKSSETPPRPTFAEFTEAWMRQHAAANNKPSEIFSKQSKLRNHLVPTFGHIRLDQISSPMIEEFKARLLASALSPKSVNNYLATLRRFLNIACEWGVIDRVPAFRLVRVPPPETRFLTEDELQRLLSHAHSGVPRAMMLMAARTGLRFSELVALRWEDLDIERRWVCVRRAYVRGYLGTPKSNSTRFVYLPTEVIGALHSLGERREGLLFQWRTEGPIHHKCADWWIRQAARRAELTGVHWHLLRHTYASHLAMRGAPLQVVKDLLGHSTIDMTIRYAHLSPAYLMQVAQIIETHAAGPSLPQSGQPVVNQQENAAASGVSQ